MVHYQQDYDLRKKKLLLIGCGRAGRTNVIRVLRSLGLSLIVCLHNEVTWADDYVDDWIICDSVHRLEDQVEGDLAPYLSTLPPNFDRSQLSCKQVRLILKYQKEKNIVFDGAYSYDDYSVLLCSYICRVFGWKGLSFDLAEIIKNKASWRKLCTETKENIDKELLKMENKETALRFVIPRYELLSEESLEHIQRTFNFPVVIKPIFGAGKIGVKKICSFSELMKHFEENKLKPKPFGDFLVEEYFEGSEVDIDMLVQDNELKFACISDNFPALGDNFMEAGGQIPATLISGEEKEALLCMAKEFSKCGLRSGCLHFEARCRKRREDNQNGQQYFVVEVMAIELNLRIGGAEVFSFVLSAHRVNLVRESVRIALGFPVQLPSSTPANFSAARASYKVENGKFFEERSSSALFCCSTNFQASRSGYFSCARFPPDLLREANLQELVIFCAPGLNIQAPPEGNSYLGWMVASGSTAEEAVSNLQRFSSQITFGIVDQWSQQPSSADLPFKFPFSFFNC